MTFVDRIREQCQQNGSKQALSLGVSGPDSVSYGTLGRYIENVSSRLNRMGVVPGAIYGLITDNALVHVVLILSLERLGAVSVTLKDVKQSELLRLAGILSDRPTPPCECPAIRVMADWLHTGDPSGAPVPDCQYAPDDICRIAFTSGSTGRPKPVALTRAMLATRIADQNAAFGEDFGRLSRRLCYIGINVLFGYRILIRTLAEGGVFCFPDADMARGVRGLALYDVQTLIGSPMQLADFGAYAERHPGSFPSVKLVICGGGRLPPALGQKLQKHICPDVMVGYGSSEAGIVAAAPIGKLDLEKGEVGLVIPGARVELVSEVSGKPIKKGRGRIRISGEGVVRGYYGEQTGQDGHFDGTWFYPGDLGHLSPDGVLTIAGRQDNVVSFGGVKTTVESVEASLHAAPGVKDLAAISISDASETKRVVAFVVPEGDWSEQAFWDYCRAKIDRIFWPTRVILLPQLPRGPGGKVDRQSLPPLV